MRVVELPHFATSGYAAPVWRLELVSPTRPVSRPSDHASELQAFPVTVGQHRKVVAVCFGAAFRESSFHHDESRDRVLLGVCASCPRLPLAELHAAWACISAVLKNLRCFPGPVYQLALASG